MLQYVLETLAFQLAFLLVYDLFLKKETFFQWNRAYLLLTFLLSLVLPKVHFEALKTTVSADAVYYPEFLVVNNTVELVPLEAEQNFTDLLTIYEWIFLLGALVMALWLLVKLYRIQRLRWEGLITYFPKFTKITVPKSNLAFSFFKQVFLGDAIPKEREPQILAHEMVHIKQWHSLDLIFFELMRIGLWFNPMVYVYQNRIAELHEFIADAKVAKNSKKEQYQLLLSEVFQTQNLSFVNQFFRKSLIKKRIVMLTKKKSKTILQLKYLLLLPLVMGMLLYSSCEREFENEPDNQWLENHSESDAALVAEIQQEIDEIKEENVLFERYRLLIDRANKSGEISTKADFFRLDLYMRNLFTRMRQGNPDSNLSFDFVLTKPLPSTAGYYEYLYRKKVFQTLDTDLMNLTSKYSYKIRPVVKSDKNLGPGEFITLRNVNDLSEDEIQKVLDAMNYVSGTERIVFLSDNEHAFLITSIYALPSINANALLSSANGQNSNSIPFGLIDEVPIFPGCENALNKKACFQEKIQEHIKKHFRYPKAAQELGLQGRVNVMFTINQNGDIENIRKRGPHKLLEDEVERIIERLPEMSPGKHQGKIAKVPFSIPVTFKLSNDIDGFGLISPDVFDKESGEIQKTVTRYNQLVTEVNRLLQHSSKENPVIKNLQEEIHSLKIEIQERLNHLTS